MQRWKLTKTDDFHPQFLKFPHLVWIGIDQWAAQPFSNLFLVLQGFLGGLTVGVEVPEPSKQDEAAEGGARCVQHQLLQELRLRRTSHGRAIRRPCAREEIKGALLGPSDSDRWLGFGKQKKLRLCKYGGDTWRRSGGRSWAFNRAPFSIRAYADFPGAQLSPISQLGPSEDLDCLRPHWYEVASMVLMAMNHELEVYLSYPRLQGHRLLKLY